MTAAIPEWTRRYLDRIGVSVEPPSTDYLTRLIRARLTTLAFENISKMHYYRQYPETGWYIPDPATYVEDIHAFDFGGLCHTGNGLFQLLLQSLGFDCYSVGVGMSEVPEDNGHLGTIVRLDSRLLYADVAVGNPIDAPIDITTEARFEACGSMVHFYPDPDNPAVYHMDHATGGRWWQWRMNPFHPVTLQAVNGEIEASNQPARVFTSMLCCKMWQPDKRRIVSLVNRSFAIHHADGRTDKRQLDTVQDFEDVLATEYGLPNLPVGEAIEVLQGFGVDVMASRAEPE